MTPISPKHSRQPIFLAGPTAVGKSSVALLLAERLPGEIISVDSMQVYRGLDIGTAKASPTDRARVPHHLIDVAEVTESFDAARFAALAHPAVAAIQARGHVPILCGGTGFYFKAFLEGLGGIPPSDAAMRTELEALPLETLLQELQTRDPVAYEKIDRCNPRRVVRAVEVIRLTGKPFSAQREDWSETKTPKAAIHHFYFLNRAASDLRARIDRRVEEMFRDGLVEETRRLLAQGLEQNPTAMQALGYRQIAEHLRGERSLAETMELVKIRTHQFAKRQLTWFRKQRDLQVIEVGAEDTAEKIVNQLLERVRS